MFRYQKFTGAKLDMECGKNVIAGESFQGKRKGTE
jgi:hypothetical protein